MIARHDDTRQRRDAAIQEIVRSACGLARWSAARDGPIEERLAAAFEAHQICIESRGLLLSASITRDVRLHVEAHVEGRFTAETEEAIRDALRRSRSPVARLALLNWPDVLDACRAAANAPDAGAAPPTHRTRS